MDVRIETRRWNILNGGLVACSIASLGAWMWRLPADGSASRECSPVAYDSTVVMPVQIVLFMVGLICLWKGLMLAKAQYDCCCPDALGLIRAKNMVVMLVGVLATATAFSMAHCISPVM